MDAENTVLQARGIPAVACCHMQRQAFAPPSHSQLTQLSELIDCALNSYISVGQGLHLQQAATAAVADLRLIDTPRVYL